MAAFSNAQITKVNTQRFNFSEKLEVVAPSPTRPYPGCPLTTIEAEAWASELDAEFKMSEEYNRWHTLDDHLDYSALLRGIHNIQVRGGDTRDEIRFLNTITDRFGHARITS